MLRRVRQEFRRVDDGWLLETAVENTGGTVTFRVKTGANHNFYAECPTVFLGCLDSHQFSPIAHTIVLPFSERVKSVDSTRLLLVIGG
jgi:hypothetical protein